jgi:hypothetical protein
MGDASLEWKSTCLKTIRDMPTTGSFEKSVTAKQDLIWIQDLERDGYITAKFRMGYFEDGDKFADSTIPNLIWDVHILDKGRELIMDFENPKPKVEPVADVEHTLLSYWRLADLEERLGMIGLFSLVFLVGYLCAKESFISRLIDLIRSIKL